MVLLVRTADDSRHRSWPTAPAGCSPRWAVSHGWSCPIPTGDQMVRLTVRRGRVAPRAREWCWLSLVDVHAAVRGARGDLVLADPPLRRRGTAGARLRTRAAGTARRRRRRTAVVRLLTGRGSDMGLQEVLVHHRRGAVPRLLRPRGLRLRRRNADGAVGPGRRMGDPEPHRRAAVLNTIGPVWDGNEVWLITAGGAMFAAFPDWYATVFSTLYLPLLVILVAMIVRIVAIEWRGKIDDPRWRAGPTSASRSARGCPRCCGASRSRSWSAGCRSTPTYHVALSISDVLNAYTLLGRSGHRRAVRVPRRGVHRAEDRRRGSRRRAAGCAR